MRTQRKANRALAGAANSPGAGSVLVRVLVAGLLLGALASTAHAGLATKFHRLVLVEGKGEAVPKGPLAWKVENNVTDEKAAAMAARITELMPDTLRRLDYTATDDAEYTVVVTVDAFEFGSRGKRVLLGPFAKKAGDGAYVGGQLKVMRGKKTIDVYNWSHIPRGGMIGGSATALGKQAGPPLLLKWTNGERDTELHIRKDS